MDLRGNHITVGELLDYAPAQAVIRRRFPMALRHPMLGAARTVTLEQLLAVAGNYIPQKMLRDTMEELKRV